jgi:hypothetical protein
MPILTDCLETHTPRILDMPAGIPFPSDPVSWALEMLEADVVSADMQCMEQDPDNDSIQKISFFDQNDPECFNRFSSGIHQGLPVHGNLELIDYRDDGGTLRKNAEWAWQVFNDEFKIGMAEKHSMGYYLKANLWMSCGEHCYKAHCDFADGFLMHITGSKHVRVWPVPEQFKQKLIYDHSDFEARMATEPLDFELKPGQILFIPASAMHEVVAHGEQPAISVSFHMGSPYPLVVLCDQLNKLKPGVEVFLPPHLSRNLKFNLSFFQLSRFAHFGGGVDGKTVPPELSEALLSSLKSKKINSAEIKELLSVWWQLALNEPIYPGPWCLPD